MLLGGCFQPTGPILGDWRGNVPSRSVLYDEQVELILDGAPDATAGTYHLVVNRPSTELGVPAHRLDWADRWTRRDVVVGGRHLTQFALANVPEARVGVYTMIDGGLLVPTIDPARPDLSPNATRLALHPVPRSSYGYGRP